jgi:hypothetical protein
LQALAVRVFQLINSNHKLPTFTKYCIWPEIFNPVYLRKYCKNIVFIPVHVNTTTFEQQLASCALTPATFIDNFGSVRSVAKSDLDQATEHAVTAGPVFRFG